MIDLKTLISCSGGVGTSTMANSQSSGFCYVLLCICALYFPCTGNMYVVGVFVWEGGGGGNGYALSSCLEYTVVEHSST